MIDEVSHWVETYKKIWEQRFDSLEGYLKELTHACVNTNAGRKKPTYAHVGVVTNVNRRKPKKKKKIKK